MAIYGLTYAKDYAKPAQVFMGNSSPTLEGPEAATQTYKKGALVKFASGNITVGTITSGGGASANIKDAIGIAARDGQNNSSAAAVKTHYHPLTNGSIFEMAVSGVDTSAAKYTLKATDLGLCYGIDYSGTSKVFFVNKSQTTAASVNVRVVGLKDPASTVCGHCYVVFFKNTVLENI